MKTLIFSILALCAATTLIVGCGGRKKAQEAQAEAERQEAALQDSLKQVQKMEDAKAVMAELCEEPIFDIVTSLGTIKVKLYKDTPKHRENFEKLALSGYYDGLLFHRVINGFMIQGGDPNTRDTSLVAKYGQGGPGYTVPAEFVPKYKHIKGALAAARMGDMANPKKESSGSQFYLVQDAAACSQLDGAYTVYGETVEGLNVIDEIAAVATNRRDLPLNPVRIISIKLDEVSVPKVTEPVDTTAAAEPKEAE